MIEVCSGVRTLVSKSLGLRDPGETQGPWRRSEGRREGSGNKTPHFKVHQLPSVRFLNGPDGNLMLRRRGHLLSASPRMDEGSRAQLDTSSGGQGAGGSGFGP